LIGINFLSKKREICIDYLILEKINYYRNTGLRKLKGIPLISSPYLLSLTNS